MREALAVRDEANTRAAVQAQLANQSAQNPIQNPTQNPSAPTRRSQEREIAIRGFINERFGSTHAQGLFRRAVYNGSIELRNPFQKYLVDFYAYAYWEVKARSDQQVKIVTDMVSAGMDRDADILFSWLQHYDPVTKHKSSVAGYAVYHTKTNEIHVSIDDPERDVVEQWWLDARACANPGLKKPAFIAANIDLNS